MLMLIIIIILVFIYFIGSVLWVRRVLATSKSNAARPVELKACEFCGMMVNVDHAVKVQGRIFCCQDHAHHKH